MTLPERCYTFDVQYPLMVVGTAERHIQIFNLTNPNTAYKVDNFFHCSFYLVNLQSVDHSVSFEVADPRCFVLYD